MSSTAEIEGVEATDKSPVQQVEMTVPTTDDPTLPAVTFRMWVLGLISCVLLSFINQFYWYRNNPLNVSSIAAQVVVVPLGRLMARTLPTRPFFQGTRLQFTMNPGPFNIKEHVLITIFANSGAGSVYATHILSAVKLYYKREITFLPALIVMLTTQVLGFGWAGIFRKFLVEPAEMWWPGTLVQVSLFRALNEKEKRAKGQVSRTQFFIIVMVLAFAYTIFSGYFFQMLIAMSWVCWAAPKTVFWQQLGSGVNGLGLGSFAIDWSAISSYLGTPLASPWFATANIAIGYVLVMYVVTPVCYYLNIYDAKTFPIYSAHLFQSNGEKYDILSIIDSKFHLDRNAYAQAGPVHLSTFFAVTYGLGFATLTATIVHVVLFNGSEIWKQIKAVFGKGTKKIDIHTRLMTKYKSVPMWWFLVVLLANILLSLFACMYYNQMLQLPWWGLLLACVIAFMFTLPIGIISATTNQTPGLNIITEYVIGYIYPERPVANMCFKVYGYISMTQALTFLQDFKLGHYMKIAPRAMFMAQVVGSVVSAVVYTGTAWFMMESIPNLCDSANLSKGSPWTCPNDGTFFTASVIWGLLGPRRIFGNLGEYGKVNWFFFGGAIAPVFAWLAHKIYPDTKWISLINLPVLIGATSMMPPASSVNFNSWLICAFLSGYVVYRYRPEWWKRYNYVTSGGLDAGSAFLSVTIAIVMQFNKGFMVDWWGNNVDGCPLASCPTAKGIIVDGCPVF
ncbi:hypothetical protein ACFE04_029449 [Oxalis oulophora]